MVGQAFAETGSAEPEAQRSIDQPRREHAERREHPRRAVGVDFRARTVKAAHDRARDHDDFFGPIAGDDLDVFDRRRESADSAAERI